MRFCIRSVGQLSRFRRGKGVQKGPLPQKMWRFEEGLFLLFPNLESADFEKLRRFAHHQKWPYTARGLFKKMASQGIEGSDPELVQFFCHTPHFILLETLFARTRQPIQRKTLLALALESGWEELERYYREQHRRCSFSTQTRRTYLLKALARHSSTAATLLLLTDAEFALHELNDRQVAALLDLLPSHSPRTLQFAQHVASSPRGDTVCRLQSPLPIAVKNPKNCQE